MSTSIVSLTSAIVLTSQARIAQIVSRREAVVLRGTLPPFEHGFRRHNKQSTAVGNPPPKTPNQAPERIGWVQSSLRLRKSASDAVATHALGRPW